MQGARSRSPLRGLIDGNAFSLPPSMVSQNLAGNLVQRGSSKKQMTASGSGMSSQQNFTYQMSHHGRDNEAQNLADTYSAYNLAMGGTTTPTSQHQQLTVLKRDAQEAGLSDHGVDESSDSEEDPKPQLKPGKKTKGRVKIKMEFIQNKLRRYTTFSKRKTGIMKKAYELSTLTGTQVMLLVASETGHVYTFATRKLQPMITSDSGKALIQTCLNSPDVSGGQNDQRMNPTGYEETELNYAVSEEEMRAMEPGTELLRHNPSPPSDSDDVMRRPTHLQQMAPRPLMGQGRPQGAPRDKRHLLHPRRVQPSSGHQQRALAPNTSAVSSNGAGIPLQVSSALQLDGLPTDALGQPYLTIPLPVSLANHHQQLIQPLLGQSLRLGGQTTTLSAQNSLAGMPIDATKRNGK